ncbi:unnamed protein product [Vicia faba]|uniref:S-protein homolog n=1 Tax=Vicia faba TaxID=3906 RepID=A0AAV0YK92_VICFA|nr:unnamed protein product [Vicia faba]
MSLTLMKIVVPISLVLLLVVVSEALIFPKQVHLEVTNRLSNKRELYLHCYERYGDDLGEYILFPGGQFIYSFKPRIIGKSSKYYCSVKWIGSNLKWFDLWSQGRDSNAGQFIKWTLEENEACRFDNTGSNYLCVAYNP